MPACATPKVLDEVTQRCVHLEDCEWPGLLTPPPVSCKSPVSLTSHAHQSPLVPGEAESPEGPLEGDDPLKQAGTHPVHYPTFHRQKK